MKHAQHAPLSFVLLVACLLSCSPAAAAQDLQPKIDEYMRAAMKVDRFSGAILVARAGKVIASKGYGMADLENDVPNTPETKFRLGSITKQFTSAAIMLLQERGQLSVQDSVCKYVAPCPEAWQPVTIHQVLSHTAGIPNFTGFPDYTKTMRDPATAESVVARFRDRPLDFKPGESWRYSNSGYVLLGYIIERVSGQPYEKFVTENIFAPLRMNDTGYDHTDAIIKHRAHGYARANDQIVNAAYMDMSIPSAAGALYSTVGDLYLWDQALYTDKLLKPASLAAIYTPVKNEYGYGWGIAKMHDRTVYAHSGGINGFATNILRFPTERATVIVLSNYEPAPTGNIARDLAAIMFGGKYELPAERVVAKVDPAIYDAYVGEYELAPDFHIVITRAGDRLLVQATGQPQVELFPAAETKFFLKAIRADITFVKDEQGQVTHLILDQGGRRQPAKKIK